MKEKKMRKALIVLDLLIALCGLAAGVCRWIAYGSYEFFVWMVVLACACARSGMGQKQLIDREEKIEKVRKRIQNLEKDYERLECEVWETRTAYEDDGK